MGKTFRRVRPVRKTSTMVIQSKRDKQRNKRVKIKYNKLQDYDYEEE